MLFTTTNHYTETTATFNLNLLNYYAKKYNFIVVSFYSSLPYTANYYENLSNVILINANNYFEEILDNIVRKYKPKKITNNIDFFYYFQIFKYDVYKQVFIRQCYQKILKVLENIKEESIELTRAIDREKVRATNEQNYITSPNKIFTCSETSKNAIKEYYGKDAVVIQQFTNIKKFLDVPFPNYNLKKTYNVGRTDYIKNVFSINPNNYHFTQIGSSLLTDKESKKTLNNTNHYDGFFDFNFYINIIQSIPICLTPCLFETNGFTVQEALCMGKITLVNENSGGNLQFIKNNENGFVIDFKNNYEDFLDNLDIDTLKKVSKNAKETFKPELFYNALEDYFLQVC